jgi:5-methylthioadenosine/S-adenosylhomocysteine deaminase
MANRIVLRGAYALEGPRFRFERRPLDVVVEGDRITAIEPAGTVGRADQVIELPKRLLVPGLINCHFHSHEHLQRGRTENLPLELWQHYVRTPVPVPLTPRQIYLRTALGAIESLRTGATAMVDDMAVGGAIVRENVNAALQAYEDVGVRALVGFSMMDKAMLDNFPFVDLVPPDVADRMRAMPRPSPDAYLGLVRDLAMARHPKTSRVGVAVTPSAPQRCTETFLTSCARLAEELDLPLLTHVQETRLQVVTGLELYGMPIVEYLAKIGFLSPRTSLIHAVWLNPREITALADAGASAQHNPWSNMTLGSGVQPTRALLEAGVNVSLGSDGSCSTVTANMLNVVGSAAAVSKLRGDDYDRWLTAEDALRAGTQGGAKALGFGGELGVIGLGARADLVAYRLDTASFAPLNDPVRQLVYTERGAGLDFAMVAGGVVLSDGRLTRVDEAKLLGELETEWQALAPQYAAAEASVAPVREAIEKVYRKSLATAVAPDTYPARFP